MSIRISKKMHGKMTGFHTLNTSPLDNKFCLRMRATEGTICSYCYSCRALETYAPTARKMWKENGKILSRKIIREEELPVTRKKYFRFQSHGELLNEKHYINLVNIAKKNPQSVFLLPTKKKAIVGKLGKMGAENLILSYSEPLINHLVEELPDNFDRRFSVFTKEYAKEHGIDINCAGKRCIECLQCYTIGNNLKFVNEYLR